MSIKDLTGNEEAFFSEVKKEVPINVGGKTVTFYARTLSYLENQNISGQVAAHGKNGLAMLVAASITDEEGNKFTYDEVIKLKQKFAKPLFDAALEVNAKGLAEKN